MKIRKYSPEAMLWEQFGIKPESRQWFTLGVRNTSSINSYTVTLFDANSNSVPTDTWTILTSAFSLLAADVGYYMFINGVQTPANGTAPIVAFTPATLLSFLNGLGVGSFIHYTDTVNSTEVYYVQSPTAALTNILTKSLSRGDTAYTVTLSQNLSGTEIALATASGTYTRLNTDINNNAYTVHRIFISSPSQTNPFDQLVTITFTDANGVSDSCVFSMNTSLDAYQEQIGLLLIDLKKEKLDLSGNTTFSFLAKPLMSMNMLFHYERVLKSDQMNDVLSDGLTKMKQ